MKINIFITFLLFILLFLNCPVTTDDEKSNGKDAGNDNQSTTTSISPNNPTDEYFVFVDVSNGSNGAEGTAIDPVDDINEGINIAYMNGKDVCVAQGDYEVDSNSPTNPEITILEGVSIYGGYNNVNGIWERGDISFRTYIINTATSGTYTRAIRIPSNVTNSTVIDGFWIKAGGGTSPTAIMCYGSPTISNNQIYGYTGLTPPDSSFSIICEEADPVIKNNQIDAGKGDNTFDLYLYKSSPVILSNKISGGDEGNYSFLIYCYSNSNPEISENSLLCSGSTTTTFGIYEVSDSDEPEYVRNNFFGSNFDYYYRDYSSGVEHFCTTFDEVNSLDENGYNPANSVYNNDQLII